MKAKVRDRHDLSAYLTDRGVDLHYDVRSQRWTRGRGSDVLNPQDMSLLVDDSQGLVPDPRSQRGRRIWEAFSVDRQYDPLADWLDFTADQHEPLLPDDLPELLWPGRLSRVDVDLVRWSWRALFLAVVARAYDPPVRWDVVPILQGPQGCGKSTVVTNLLPKVWTNGGLPLKGVKDFDASRKVMEYTEGKAILESSEMVGMNANTREPIKAWLTQDVDRSTRKYAVQAVDVPRRYVVVGTTNDMHPVPYDPSGGRRWIVTTINGGPTDVGEVFERLVHLRRRCWAAAVHEYRETVEFLGKGAVASVLAVPDNLRDLHETHAQAHMWQPEGGLFG